MPEGDTVYRSARNLNAALAGQVLTRCDIRVPAFATVDLTGETIEGVASRGKHLLMHVGEYTLHSHLKMEGSWHLYRHGSKWFRPEFQARAILGDQRRGRDLVAARMADQIEKAHRPEILTCLDVGHGGGVERGQGAHRGALLRQQLFQPEPL
ncbi:MAG TPA: DNA-formamidopyrimidine glycosylase family protein, partial [Rhodoglobus sp.]|nr:DNA-formamidopyrimidine glycosylase family protein [Rhodoglobus sp.]